MFSFLQSYCEHRFHLRELHTDIGTEVIAGLTIFATMGYVLAVVPRMMAEAGLPQGSSAHRVGSDDISERMAFPSLSLHMSS